MKENGILTTKDLDAGKEAQKKDEVKKPVEKTTVPKQQGSFLLPFAPKGKSGSAFIVDGIEQEVDLIDGIYTISGKLTATEAHALGARLQKAGFVPVSVSEKKMLVVEELKKN